MMTLTHEASDDEDSQDNLDEEFRQILFVIKPYILRINSHHHIEQYKIWLERLSDSEADEKLERNKYMLELANQIHDGTLKPPFTRHPPYGALPPLKKYSTITQKKSHRQEEWPYISPTCRRDYSQRSKQDLSRTSSTKLSQKNTQKKKNVKYKTAGVVTFEKLGVSQEGAETSSWCDLSDANSENSIHTYACGDTDKSQTDVEDDKILRQKLSKMHETEGLKLQKLYAKQYETEVSKKISQHKDANQNPSEKEVEALKLRIKDLIEVKNALRDTHCLTQDRKRLMENLQTRLTMLESQNEEFKSVIDLQTKKIIELEINKSKAESEFKENFTKLRNTEVETLEQRHKDEIQKIERSLRDKLDETQNGLQKQIQEVKDTYETKIKDLTKTHEISLKEKEEQILRLKNEIKARSEELNSNEQIIHLKKCISKMDKLLQKSEKDYLKKIEKLKQELEIKEATMQMKLQTQKAELMVRSNATKQEELKSAINSLEAKYKKMLEIQQSQAWEVNEQKEKIISGLRYSLDKHESLY